jgi:PKD repeat protein
VPLIVNQDVHFTDLSANTPTAWSWDFGDGLPPLIGAGTSNAQNPTYRFTNLGTYTVRLTATNCKGSTQITKQVQVLPSCTATVVPTADFTWAPQGPLAGFPNQMQPYVGQTVTLTDSSTNAPTSWQWYDFQELTLPPTTVYVPTFTATWTTPGDKNVRMKATNCIGQSAEVLKVVHVYDDVRPVVADFSWSPANPAIGSPVTFTAAQGSSYGNPTGFTWSFDDGTSQTGAMVTYTFKCGGPRTIALTSARGSVTGRTDKAVTVTGQTCGPESVMTVDAAKLNGLNGTSWRTDVRIFNPSDHASSIKLAFLPVGQNNVDPFTAGPYPIGPMATLVVNNILDYVSTNLGKDFQKTAMRVTYENTDSVAPIVMARTYTPSPTGGNYGQFAPGIAVVPNSTPSPLWITGLRNNGLADGFRTNYSLVNLRDDAGGVGGIKFTLFDGTGAQQGVATLGLAPFGYLQDSVSKLFGGKFDDIGIFSLKVDVPQGADIQAYASVMDNHTGDPVLIPAVASPDSPVYLPAVAHLNGEAGTVWRTDLQLTNPDPNSAHTWELRYTPKGGNLPIVARNVTLAPDQSGFTDDLIAWIYQDALPADAATSGVVRIEMAPSDTSNVFPIMAARSYNVTPNGTFGQSIAPLWAAQGISSTSANKRLLITGMSSEDIARTNFGLVNLSEAQGVNFSILFYDQNGALLNPQSDGSPVPYTFALGPGGWDQDKLENRFRNAFKVNLPSNLESISAVITVSDGGPGFVYATVIDNKTGDPNFIPAQQAP